MAETKIIVLRTHQAFWTKKRGYGLTEEGAVIEFNAPTGTSPTMYFGGLMDRTKAALSEAHCFGVVIDDAQIARQITQGMKPDEARRLFQKTLWPASGSYVPAMDPDDIQAVIRVGKTF